MTETQITDICAAKMKKAVSSLCSVQKPRCAGWTGSRGGRAALGKAAVGVQILYLQFAPLILFRSLQGGGCLQTRCIVRQEGLGF